MRTDCNPPPNVSETTVWILLHKANASFGAFGLLRFGSAGQNLQTYARKIFKSYNVQRRRSPASEPSANWGPLYVYFDFLRPRLGDFQHRIGGFENSQKTNHFINAKCASSYKFVLKYLFSRLNPEQTTYRRFDPYLFVGRIRSLKSPTKFLPRLANTS